jgi:uncharacterized protein
LEFRQSFTVPFAPDRVWHCFHDIEAVVRCLPGAGLTEPPRDGKLSLSMTVKLGPIVANFAGQGEMTLDETARSGRIAGGGSDRKSGSRIKGEAIFSLHGETDGTAATRIEIGVEYSIAGSLAQFSRAGLIRELAERMTVQFSDNLRRKLESDPVELAALPAAPGATARPPPAAAPPGPANTPIPLDIGRTFWTMVVRRLKRWLGPSAKSSDDADPRRD